jgi:hypothetical protein
MAARTFRPALPLSLGVAAIALVCGRLVLDARHAVHTAEVAWAIGDRAEAARSYLDALRAYVPGSPFERQALEGLGRLAAEAAHAGDRDGERRAWEAVRTGLLGTRSMYVPYPARLAEANLHLTELDSTAPFPPADPGALVVDGRGGRFGRPTPWRGPGGAFILMALLGFAIWVGAIVTLIHHIHRGIDHGPIDSGPRAWHRFWAMSGVLLPALFVVGFALFLIGLRFA